MTILNYTDHNQNAAQVVLLIHGLGANLSSWDYQIEPLVNAGFRVIVPEMRGFGKTPYNGEDMSANLMAQDCFELIQGLGIEKPHVVGLSMGGAIAQRYAIDYPENLSKLVLANTAAKFAHKLLRNIILIPRYLAFRLLGVERWANSISGMVFRGKEQAEFREEFRLQLLEADQDGYNVTFKSLLNMDITAEIGNIKAETLIIGGKQDLTTPLRHQKLLNQAIPNSKLVIFDAGHVTPIVCAKDFNREMLAFLTKNN